MKQCPKCQVMVKDTAKFCIKCGFNIKKFEEEQAATAEPVFCPECGTSCQSIDRFCPECGYEIAQDLSNPPAAEDVFSDNWLADIVDTSETTQAEDKTEFAAFTYEEHTDGTYTVTGLKDTGILRITLPEGVVEIGEGAFANSGILQAILPEGLLKIGKNAFAGCQLLNSVTLPSSLCVVEDEAFADCTRLEVDLSNVSIIGTDVLKNTKTEIRQKEEEEAARKAEYLKNFQIDGTTLVRYLGIDTDVVIPDGIEAIGKAAFGNNNSVHSVVIPSGVKIIQENAFSCCRNLEGVTLPHGVARICDYAFSYTAIKQIDIPDSVSSIGAYAFEHCDDLKVAYVSKSTSYKGIAFPSGTKITCF